jgi:hypothetical protein
MKAKNLFKTWGAFVLLNILTVLVYEFGWASDGYQYYLAILGTLTTIAAGWILFKAGLNWLSVLVIFIGLLIGQWWFLESVLMYSFISTK